MAFYGGQPQQGLDWYRLLSIYHTLGKESSSHKEISDIGKELKTLHVDHNAAIQNINTQLTALIATNTNTLSAGDLSSLKQAIVDGMKQHADENPEQCAARVETDGESVLFTDGVKEVLAGLVRQKARVLEEVDFSKMIDDIGSIDAKLRADGKMDRDIESIKTRLDQGVPLLAADYLSLTKWKTEFDAAEARNNPSTQAFATRRDALADAIVAKMGNGDNSSTDGRKSFSDDDKAALANAVVGKMGLDNDTGTRAFKAALAEAVVAKLGNGGIPNPITEAFTTVLGNYFQEQRLDAYTGGYSANKPRSIFLYLSTTDVHAMFVNGDSRLYLASDNPEAQCERHAIYFASNPDTMYNISTELTSEKVVQILQEKYTFFGWGLRIPDEIDVDGLKTLVNVMLAKTPPILDVDIYRLVHTVVVRSVNDPTL